MVQQMQFLVQFSSASTSNITVTVVSSIFAKQYHPLKKGLYVVFYLSNLLKWHVYAEICCPLFEWIFCFWRHLGISDDQILI